MRDCAHMETSCQRVNQNYNEGQQVRRVGPLLSCDQARIFGIQAKRRVDHDAHGRDAIGRFAVHVPAHSLRHGQSYRLELETPGPGSTAGVQEFCALQVTALHLLRTDSFAIVGHHADPAPQCEYRAEFRDFRDHSQVAAVLNLPCSEDRHVPVKLYYQQLGHEQDTLMELSTDGAGRPAFFCCVRAVRHESLKSRMGFVGQVARNVAHELHKANLGVRRLPLEDFACGTDSHPERPRAERRLPSCQEPHQTLAGKRARPPDRTPDSRTPMG